MSFMLWTARSMRSSSSASSSSLVKTPLPPITRSELCAVAVSRGADDHELGGNSVAREPGAHEFRLPASQRAAPRPNPQRISRLALIEAEEISQRFEILEFAA